MTLVDYRSLVLGLQNEEFPAYRMSGLDVYLAMFAATQWLRMLRQTDRDSSHFHGLGDMLQIMLRVAAIMQDLEPIILHRTDDYEGGDGDDASWISELAAAADPICASAGEPEAYLTLVHTLEVCYRRSVLSGNRSRIRRNLHFALQHAHLHYEPSCTWEGCVWGSHVPHDSYRNCPVLPPLRQHLIDSADHADDPVTAGTQPDDRASATSDGFSLHAADAVMPTMPDSQRASASPGSSVPATVHSDLDTHCSSYDGSTASVPVRLVDSPEPSSLHAPPANGNKP